jgi:hypothetical protein
MTHKNDKNVLLPSTSRGGCPEGYYNYYYLCTNCKDVAEGRAKSTQVYIRKGLRTTEVDVSCDNCGCALGYVSPRRARSVASLRGRDAYADGNE